MSVLDKCHVHSTLKVAGFVFSVAQCAEGNGELRDFSKHGFSSETIKKLDAVGQFLESLALSADVFNKYRYADLSPFVYSAFCCSTVPILLLMIHQSGFEKRLYKVYL